MSHQSQGSAGDTLQNQIGTILKLEEERQKAKSKFIAHQNIVKIWFNKHKDKEKKIELGDLVLKWDRENEPKVKHSKFQNLWLGPF